jgi:Flp pilus assembly protein TadG
MNDSGQALAELALVAPLLILLLVAIFQFAFVFQTQMGITNAVREAARRAAAVENPDETWVRRQLCADAGCTAGLLPDNVQGFTVARLQGGAANVSFCTYPIIGSSDAQYRVIVGVTYDHPEFFPLAQIAALAAGKPSGGAWNWTVDGSAEMRLEHDLPSVTTLCL